MTSTNQLRDVFETDGSGNIATTRDANWTVPYYVKGLALGVPIYFVAIHVWAWVLIAPYLLHDGKPDFRQIYSSAYMVRTGHSAQLYDYNLQKEYQDRLITYQKDGLPFIRPAYEALIFVPLSYFSFRTAYILLLITNIGLLAVCLLLLRPWLRNLYHVYVWLPAALFVGFEPIGVAFIMGQDSVLLLVLLAVSFILLTKRLPGWAGLVAGLGLFKFQILLPVALLFLAWRRWRFLLGFGVSTMALAGISLWIAGFAGTKMYFEYLTSVANLTSGIPQFPVLWQLMANVHGLMFGLTGSWLPKFWLETLALLLSSCVLGWTFYKGARVKENDAGLFLLALPCAILVAHYVFIHDLSVLLLPTVILLNAFLPSEDKENERERAIGRIAAIMFIAPVVESFSLEHMYLVALAVGALLFAVSDSLDVHRSATPIVVG